MIVAEFHGKTPRIQDNLIDSLKISLQKTLAPAGKPEGNALLWFAAHAPAYRGFIPRNPNQRAG